MKTFNFFDIVSVFSQLLFDVLCSISMYFYQIE